MSGPLSNESTVSLATGLVNELVNTAGHYHGVLVELDEPEIGHYHPDKPVFEQLTVGYFALAVETQGVLNQLCVLEKQTPPSTLLSRVPDHTRKRILEMAKRHRVIIDSSVLKAVPFDPLREKK